MHKLEARKESLMHAMKKMYSGSAENSLQEGGGSSSLAWLRVGEWSDLNVHLERRDCVLVPGNLEVHVP